LPDLSLTIWTGSEAPEIVIYNRQVEFIDFSTQFMRNSATHPQTFSFSTIKNSLKFLEEFQILFLTLVNFVVQATVLYLSHKPV
jgi:hypothetical protein